MEDVAPSGYAMDRATIRQKKTSRPLLFELTDQTRQAIDEYLRLTVRAAGSGMGGQHRLRPREALRAFGCEAGSGRRRGAVYDEGEREGQREQAQEEGAAHADAEA